MYKNNRFLAVIPARGGSKGIPKKNIVNVLGKPLIQYSIEEAIHSKYIDKLIVSTDDKEIKKTSIECGAEVPFLRPKELATDSSKTIDTLIHAIDYFRQRGESFDYIILLQPTQPLRKHWHIDKAIEKIVTTNENGLVSVSKVKDHPILIREKDENDNLARLINITSTVRRQDFLDYYKVNGAIYINKIDTNFNNDLSLNDNPLGFVMDSQYNIDIDEPIDLEVLKIMLKKLV